MLSSFIYFLPQFFLFFLLNHFNKFYIFQKRGSLFLFFSWLNFINLPFLSSFIYFLPQFFLFFFFIAQTNLHANFSKNIKSRISFSFLLLINFINLPFWTFFIYFLPQFFLFFFFIAQTNLYTNFSKNKKGISLFFSSVD